MAIENISRKEQITTAAARLFREKGFEAASMRDIAASLGIEAASLYSHIKSKDEILETICFNMAGKLLKAIDEVNNIISKPPSAELRPNQKDSDSLPDYAILDKVLFQYIERRQGPKEIIALGIEESLVHRILKLVNTNEYKRNQFCPIIRVSTKAFGVGRRMPIVGKYLS